MLAAGCAQTTAATTGLARGMGWVAQQSGTGDSLFGVCATSADGAWAVGEAGHLLATSDGGAHWRSVSCGTSEDLFAVTFTDRSHGWLLADDEVVRTSDAGASWSVVRLGSGLALQAMAFTGPLNGIVVGSIARGNHQVGIIFSTSDGGRHWRAAWEQSSPFPADIHPDAIGVVARQHIVVASATGGGVVLSSSDGGANWSLATVTNVVAGIQAFVFPAGPRGWGVGIDGRIVETPDGGRTWRLRETIGQSILTAVDFASKTEAWAVGTEGTLVHTADSGSHWSAVPGLARAKALQAVSFDWGSGHGWAVGEDGTIYAYR